MDSSTLEELRRRVAEIEGGAVADKPSAPGSTERSTQSGLPNPPKLDEDSQSTRLFDDRFVKVDDRVDLLLGYGEYSREKMRKRLLKEGFDEEAVEHALDRACRYGFIDDARYAEILILSRIRKGKGRAGIERDLLEAGIEPETVSGWPDAFPFGEEDEVERALETLRRKPPRSKNPHDTAYRRLVGRGFSPQIASKAATLWCDADGVDV